MRSVARLTGSVAASLAVLLAAQGWLYQLRPMLPRFGPAIGDALPLDELPRHDAVPLLLFAGVWAIAGVLVGLVARRARLDRLIVGVAAAIGTTAWLLATTWASLVVVRQVAAEQALHAALALPAVYAAAAIVGLATALLGRSDARSDRVVAILAACVAAGGILDVASALTQDFRGAWLMAVPDVVPRIASASIVPIGLALVVLARGLRRRRRRAWQLTLALALVASFYYAARGFNYEVALVNMLLAVALVARRNDFDGDGDPATRSEFFVRAALYLTAIFAYGAIALWVNRVEADRPYTLPFALSETAQALAGMHPRGSAHLSGDFGKWFPLSVFFLGLTAVVSLLRTWLAPWRYRAAQEARERDRARELVSRFGIDTLAPFVLRPDKSYFFAEDELAFLAYRVVAGVALVSGDPVGPLESVERLLPAFLRFTARRGWRVAILGAGERYLELYRNNGLQAFYHGDEGVIDVASFSLEGRAIRKVRQSVARLGRAGYTVQILRAGELTPRLADELEQVAVEWRGTDPQRGFAMECDSLATLDGDDAVFVVGFAPDGSVGGFFHLAVAHAGKALSLSSMPRSRTTPNGFNEWLVVETVEWARMEGFDRVSMNFSPFAAVLAVEGRLSRKQRLQRGVLRHLKGTFQLDNLFVFNRKFFPDWERRYVVFERLGDLPRIGVAGLAAEGFLPLGGRS